MLLTWMVYRNWWITKNKYRSTINFILLCGGSLTNSN